MLWCQIINICFLSLVLEYFESSIAKYQQFSIPNSKILWYMYKWYLTPYGLKRISCPHNNVDFNVMLNMFYHGNISTHIYIETSAATTSWNQLQNECVCKSTHQIIMNILLQYCFLTFGKIIQSKIKLQSSRGTYCSENLSFTRKS